MPFCTDCGARQPDAARFCIHCGRPLFAVVDGKPVLVLKAELARDRPRLHRERLRKSEAWQQWTMGGVVSLHAAQKLFRMTEYTKEEVVLIKIALVRREFEGDKELTAFIEEAARAVLEGRVY